MAFDAARRDRVLAPDAAALDHAPARRRERGVDVLGSGLGFVHGVSSSEFAGEGLMQQRLLQRVECGELALVDGFEALGFGMQRMSRSTIARCCSRATEKELI